MDEEIQIGRSPALQKLDSQNLELSVGLESVQDALRYLSFAVGSENPLWEFGENEKKGLVSLLDILAGYVENVLKKPDPAKAS